MVATRVPGCVDAVQDGVTGTLIAARDAAALETALATYLDAPALRLNHGKAGRARVVREFRSERLWAALSEVYEELVPRRMRPCQTTPMEVGS